MSPTDLDNSRGLRISLAGLFINGALAIIKLVTGIVGHSYALIADAVESMADIFGSIVVWSGLRIARRPPDENHPYGHGKAEPLAALVVALMLIGAAIGISIEAVREIITPHHAPAAYTLWVLLAIIVIKELLYRIGRRIARDSESSAVLADAWHHRSDALTSLAAAIGISIALIGGEGYEPADDWAALVASAVILYNAIRIMRPPLGELMDIEPAGLTQEVGDIARRVQGVVDVEKVLARKSGTHYWVDWPTRSRTRCGRPCPAWSMCSSTSSPPATGTRAEPRRRLLARPAPEVSYPPWTCLGSLRAAPGRSRAWRLR
jgi:cation diffusion facilitator family transporter